MNDLRCEGRPAAAAVSHHRRARPDDEVIRLGMPQLGRDGLSLNWLLRECCHRQWWAIANHFQTAPSQIVDRNGERAMASVVACVIHGDPAAFREDETASFDEVVAPTPATRWRGEYALASNRAAWMVVELVTAFARKAGPSNRDLAAADLSGAKAPFCGRRMQRAGELRARAQELRQRFQNDTRPPHLTFPIYPDVHLNGMGLVYFANFVDFFLAAEANALPPTLAIAARRREIYYFGNLDAGDQLDVVCDVSVRSVAPVPHVVVEAAARRRSDGRTIAVWESERAVHAPLAANYLRRPPTRG